MPPRAACGSLPMAVGPGLGAGKNNNSTMLTALTTGLRFLRLGDAGGVQHIDEARLAREPEGAGERIGFEPRHGEIDPSLHRLPLDRPETSRMSDPVGARSGLRTRLRACPTVWTDWDAFTEKAKALDLSADALAAALDDPAGRLEGRLSEADGCLQSLSPDVQGGKRAPASLSRRQACLPS